MTDTDETPESAEDRPVLVVDDERSMREMLTVMLNKEGHPTEIATSGDEAMEMLDDELLTAG